MKSFLPLFFVTVPIFLSGCAGVTNAPPTPDAGAVRCASFETATNGVYTNGADLEGWVVTGNEVGIVTDPTGACSGSNYLALTSGSIARTFATNAASFINSNTMREAPASQIGGLATAMPGTSLAPTMERCRT
jgi:hypothetical protein